MLLSHVLRIGTIFRYFSEKYPSIGEWSLHSNLDITMHYKIYDLLSTDSSVDCAPVGIYLSTTMYYLINSLMPLHQIRLKILIQPNSSKYHIFFSVFSREISLDEGKEKIFEMIVCVVKLHISIREGSRC